MDLALTGRVGAYGYGLYQEEIDEYIGEVNEWMELQVRLQLTFFVATALSPSPLFYTGPAAALGRPGRSRRSPDHHGVWHLLARP
jgi:hypothetical protein